MFGTYPKSVNTYFENHHIKLEIEDGDMELLRSCHPDFIGFNCYGNDTVEVLDFMRWIMAFLRVQIIVT